LSDAAFPQARTQKHHNRTVRASEKRGSPRRQQLRRAEHPILHDAGVWLHRRRKAVVRAGGGAFFVQEEARVGAIG
jgi:hypothetical protein